MSGAIQEKAMPKRPGHSDKPKQVSIVQLKGTPAWKTWFVKLTKFSRMPAAVLIDIALKEWAQKNGFSDEPPER